MLDVNLKGTVYAVRAALPHMLGREGDVVTLASEAGRRGLPYEAVYCASKFGQVGFTRALDHELREHGIRCTNICPGGVATDFALDDGRGRTPDALPGMMTAEDVAEFVIFALERPRHLRMLETALRPMTEDVLGLARLGCSEGVAAFEHRRRSGEELLPRRDVPAERVGETDDHREERTDGCRVEERLP